METITKNIYSFDELSEEAKQKALNNLCDINTDFDWYSSIYEDAKNIGLNITEFDLDRNRHAEGHFLLSACEVAQNILNEHGESCETYKTAKSFLEEWQPIFNNYMDESHKDYESNESEDIMQEMEDNFLQSLLEDYSILLQNEYEYLYSDEAIIETIEANDYKFTEDGNIFSHN